MHQLRAGQIRALTLPAPCPGADASGVSRVYWTGSIGDRARRRVTFIYNRRGKMTNRLMFITVFFFLVAAGSRNLQAQSFNCSSEDGRRHYCAADVSGGVRMIRQRSGSPCIQGKTWGYDRRGVWVDRGCRADFVSGGRPGQGARPPFGGGGGPAETVNCSSEDGGRHYCGVDTSRGVRMLRQRSGSPCIQGKTWGYDRRGIWVDRGCRADFTLGGRR